MEESKDESDKGGCSTCATTPLLGEELESGVCGFITARVLKFGDYIPPLPDESDKGGCSSCATPPLLEEKLASAEFKSSSVDNLLLAKMQYLEKLRASHLELAREIKELEQELVESKVEIKQSENRCHVLESGLLSSRRVQEAVIKTCDEPLPKIDDSIVIVGGFDGCRRSAALNFYYPSQDTMKSLMPMMWPRSCASAVTSNGELYMLGGSYGKLCHDTVESYIPTEFRWVLRPSLNRGKESLAGASVNGKIFVLGGGNHSERYSDVEYLDINLGKWIPTQSMIHKRFAPAAAEINGAIFVVGGSDERNSANSVERFDPRENLWTRLESMSTGRASHSLTVLNGKLYALGGMNNEGEVVSSVEIFDPRLGSWMMGEAMNYDRGYAGAVVIGERIYVIGGVNTNDVLNTIECYKDGGCWEVMTNLKAVGKRAFFSAILSSALI